MNPPLTYVHHSQADYPAQLPACLGAQAPATITLWGNRDLWFQRARPLLALFCSTKAPASVILRVHDLAQQWRAAGVTVIGGFHSPAEQEVLVVLLRGPGAVIVCPARSIVGMRLKAEYKEPLAAGRLLLLSPFEEKVRRITAETATARNRFVAALADRLLIAHAEPGGKTAQLAREAAGWGREIVGLGEKQNQRWARMQGF